MGSLFPKPITGERLQISYTAGIAQIDGTVPITTQGSIQPFSGKETEGYPILRKDKGLIQIFCDDQLQVTKNGSTEKGDIIFFDGGRWELIRELTRNQGIINHFRYVAQYLGEI
jgi:hypothetical protein